MIDKASIALASVAAVSKLIAEAAPTDLPHVGDLANLTAVGALIWLVLRTVPKLLSDHKDERAEKDKAHAAERQSWLSAFREELRDLKDTFGGK